MEKVCLALVFAAKKLRNYFLAHQIRLISKADFEIPDNQAHVIRSAGQVVIVVIRIRHRIRSSESSEGPGSG